MNTPIDTVVLDVDGTLVDSVYQHVQCWAGAFADHDLAVPAWRLHRAIGLPGHRLVTEVAGDTVEDAHGDELREGHSRRFEDMLEQIRPLPGASRLLAELARRGYRRTVVSSGGAEQTRSLLSGILDPDELDALLTGDDLDSAKPDAEPIHAAVEAVEGRRALVVGDAIWDMRAAASGGHAAVGVLTGGVGAAELSQAGAERVFTTLDDLVEGLDEVIGALTTGP